ncbi:MAG: 1-(5-phosphoribosyl)-5-[(5-phosphoribosylamino)methylideneamino] imidazole-4-carboxamide isomerase [Chloroflexi bacterium]|nr:MAG: 1-(5-phosphoribosyl)-5-[(5-phosphoribosylamino)methylideneamino] imidazole-4-carboxamide isomerase [Chloroflexota bacterium]
MFVIPAIDILGGKCVRLWQGARSSGDNRAVIESLIRSSSITVQVAGGIRSSDQIDAWLAMGATAVVMGTAAVREPELLAECEQRHAGQVLAALDIRYGRPAVAGWLETETIDIHELIARWDALPLAGLILTATDRDGTMAGPDLDTLARLRRMSRLPIQYSGGVSSLDDLRAVREADATAVILGRSLYEGKVLLEDALAL